MDGHLPESTCLLCDAQQVRPHGRCKCRLSFALSPVPTQVVHRHSGDLRFGLGNVVTQAPRFYGEGSPVRERKLRQDTVSSRYRMLTTARNRSFLNSDLFTTKNACTRRFSGIADPSSCRMVAGISTWRIFIEQGCSHLSSRFLLHDGSLAELWYVLHTHFGFKLCPLAASSGNTPSHALP